MQSFFEFMKWAGLSPEMVSAFSMLFGMGMTIYGFVKRYQLKSERAAKISARIDDRRFNPLCLMDIQPDGKVMRLPGKSIPDITSKFAPEIVAAMRNCVEVSNEHGLRGVLRIRDGVKVGATELRPTVQKAMYEFANEHRDVYDLFAVSRKAGRHTLFCFATFEHREDLKSGITAQWRQEGMTYKDAKLLAGNPDGHFTPLNPDHVKNISLRRAVALLIVRAVEGAGESKVEAQQILKEICIMPSLPAVDPAGGRA